MGKLEKLREINITINNIIIDLETRIFIENININENKYNKNEPQIII